MAGSFLNRGTIRAEGAGELIQVNVIGGGSLMTHTGLMEAVDGATLGLSGPVDATGGTIRARGAGSVVLITHQSPATGGTYAGLDGGVVRVSTPGNPIMEGVRLAGKVEVLPNAEIRTVGVLTNDARLTLRSTGSTPAIIAPFTGDLMLGGSGDLVLDSSEATSLAGRVRVGNVNTDRFLINEVGHTVRGDGQIFARVLNRGVIHADAGSGLNLSPLNLPNAITNEGTFRASGGASLVAERTPMNFAAGGLVGGVWEVGAGSMMRLAGVNLAVNAATIVLDGPGSQLLNAPTGSTSALAPLHTNQGTLALLNGRDLSTAGTLSNEGLLVVGEGSTLTVNGSLDNAGTVSGQGTVVTQRLRVNGGRLAPGASPGVLTVLGDLEFGTGSVYAFEIGADEHDRVDVIGDLIFGSTAVLEVSLFETDTMAPGDYVLFTVTGEIIGAPVWTIELPELLTSEGVGIIGQTVVLRGLAVIPEPAAVGVLALSVPLVSRRRR